MYANFCFGTPVLFMRAWACVALSGWRVKNYCQDNTRKSLGPVVYRKESPERENNSPVHPATVTSSSIDRFKLNRGLLLLVISGKK